MRRHGLSLPWDPLQVLSWVVYGACGVSYFTTQGILLPETFNYVAMGVYGVIFIANSIIAGIATAIDPADENVKKYVYGRDVAGSANRKELAPEDSENSTYCYICKVYVSQTCKHCRRCGKCVPNFDHHCRWLNTCVSKSHNYKYFFWSVILTSFVTFFQAVTCTYLIIEYIWDVDVSSSRCSKLYGSDCNEIILVVVWGVFLLVSSAAFVLLADLMIFHCGLLKSDLTTYQWILKQRELMKKMVDEHMEKRRRDTAVRREEQRKKVMEANRRELDDPRGDGDTAFTLTVNTPSREVAYGRPREQRFVPTRGKGDDSPVISSPPTHPRIVSSDV